MAEIGLIASIIGVAGAGARISITLFKMANTLGSAGHEVRFVAADTNALSLVLTNLSRTLKQKRVAAEEGEENATAILILCRSIIADSELLYQKLEPLVSGSTNAVNETLLKVRWLFEKTKFAAHRQSLEALKSTLGLLISTIMLSASTGRGTSNPAQYIDHLISALMEEN